MIIDMDNTKGIVNIGGKNYTMIQNYGKTIFTVDTFLENKILLELDTSTTTDSELSAVLMSLGWYNEVKETI